MKIANFGDILHHFYKTRLDVRQNNGNKGLRQKANKRQDSFVKEVLRMNADTVIVFGHSLWFQQFFKAFLPKSCTHDAKTCKIVNGGCIAFDFYKDSPWWLRAKEEEGEGKKDVRRAGLNSWSSIS